MTRASRRRAVGRPRLRDLGIEIGRFPTAKHNAITDVSGVRVGHVTLVSGDGALRAGVGPVRTGVTAVIPGDGAPFVERLPAASHVLNGAGELMGRAQIDEWGLCETPVLLCSTMCVGRVADAVVTWLTRRHPEIGRTCDVVIPIVGECDDSYMTDAVGRHVTAEHVWGALDHAEGGAVAEGCVGAGTGMQTFHFAGGIGTSSRRVRVAGRMGTIGALVLSNFGDREHLRIDGAPVGRVIAPALTHLPRRGVAGSIIVLCATDLPLCARQLGRVCKRAQLAVGRVGGFAANNSGELFFAWSTANRRARDQRSIGSMEVVPDAALDPVFEATVDAVEEAILNAICAGTDQRGHSGHTAAALPIDVALEALGRLRGSRIGAGSKRRIAAR